MQPESTQSRRFGRVSAACMAVLAILGCGLLLVVLVFFVLLVLDEDSVPPTIGDASLPAGVVIESADKKCGSGGCWTEMIIDTDQTSQLVVDELWARDQSCARPHVFSLRKVCTFVEDFPRGLAVILQYERLLNL